MSSKLSSVRQIKSKKASTAAITVAAVSTAATAVRNLGVRCKASDWLSSESETSYVA